MCKLEEEILTRQWSHGKRKHPPLLSKHFADYNMRNYMHGDGEESSTFTPYSVRIWVLEY